MIKSLLKLIPSKTIYAHCDIPCGIYDPYPAQIAAHTVIRMTQMIMDLKNEGDEKKYIHQLSRLTKVKEDHAEICKHEIRVIWGDYFKPEMVSEHSGLHELVFQIMKLASKSRQSVDMESAKDLLSKVQEFAEIFYQTKKMETIRIPSGYPSEGEIVTHK